MPEHKTRNISLNKLASKHNLLMKLVYVILQNKHFYQKILQILLPENWFQALILGWKLFPKVKATLLGNV